MNSVQYRIYEELQWLCRELNDDNKEEMMHDIIAVLAYWSDNVSYDKGWQNGY